MAEAIWDAFSYPRFLQKKIEIENKKNLRGDFWEKTPKFFIVATLLRRMHLADMHCCQCIWEFFDTLHTMLKNIKIFENILKQIKCSKDPT